MHQDSDTPSVKGKNYADFSREELIAEINRLKKSKKYGLVWEHKTEEVIENFKKGAQPYLKEVDDKRLELAPDESTNLIIEGDNFDALSILNYTHAGKIDVIYIDPPYNTGNKDFIYNDNYVDSEDEFRHSKWLSFIEPRLRLAKSLLNDNGALLCSINDIELYNLKLLCDNIFGEDCLQCAFIWKNTSNPNTTGNNIGVSHEYIVCFSKNKAYSANLLPLDGEAIAKYTGKDEYIEERGPYILVGLNKTGTVNDLRPNLTYDIEAPDGTIIKPKPRWRWSKAKFEQGVADGRIVFRQSRTGWAVYYKQYYLEDTNGQKIDRGKLVNTILEDYGRTTDGANNLSEIIGRGKFDFPKPAKLIKGLLLAFSKKEATILDFFAGSGTTGQAVLELNKEDGGHRQFILCTNNGDKGPDSTKIAEDITYPRIKTVITGERQDGSRYSDGIPANLRYYKIDHRQKKDSVDATRQDIVNYLEDIIKIKENTFGAVEANEDFSLYQNPEQYLGMVFDPFSLEEVIEKLTVANADKRPVKLYVFSYSRDAFEEDFGTDFEIEFVAMPEGLLKTYVNIIEDLKKEDA